MLARDRGFVDPTGKSDVCQREGLGGSHWKEWCWPERSSL